MYIVGYRALTSPLLMPVRFYLEVRIIVSWFGILKRKNGVLRSQQSIQNLPRASMRVELTKDILFQLLFQKETLFRYDAFHILLLSHV